MYVNKKYFRAYYLAWIDTHREIDSEKDRKPNKINAQARGEGQNTIIYDNKSGERETPGKR